MADELIHEVEESIKQEKLDRLWKEYGPYLIAAIILIVLMTAFITGWRNWNDKINSNQTAAVIEALAEDEQVVALEQLAGTLRPNQRAISYLTAAGLLLRDEKQNEALAKYQQAASDSELDPLFRDLAGLMAIRLEWSMGQEDMSADGLLSTLKPLWQNEKSPWHWHAHELAALIKAHEQNDFAGAREHLAVVANGENVTRSLQERAKSLDHVYALKAQKSQEPVVNTEEPEG